MIVHRAPWVLPIVSAPIRNGWVAIERGRVVAIGGPADEPPSGPHEPASPLSGATAILPGLVNAHTHLELSWMRGRVPPGDSMPAWAGRLMALRGTSGSEPLEPIADAIREVRMTGTALVGDVTNTLAAYGLLADSDLSAMIFRELLGFRAGDPQAVVAEAKAQLSQLTPYEWLRTVLVPHAPYSVSPALFRAIGSAAEGRPVSLHLGESPEEVRFLQDGSGPWRQLLENLGVWTDAWQPPRCGPVDYLEQLGLLNDRLIAVHGVQFTDREVDQLAEAGATVVTCPRSNRWTGSGTPPIQRFYQRGVRVAIGTDSLASVEDLNMFRELAAVRRIAPEIPASRLLRSATLDGAEALGFGGDLGSIEPGKQAALIEVRIPPDVGDVEEYLLRGIPPENLRWLPSN